MSDPAPASPDTQQCGRCRAHFDIVDGRDAGRSAGWWVCPACRALLLPGQSARVPS